MQSHGEQRGHVGAVPGGEGALALQSVDELAPERDRGTEGRVAGRGGLEAERGRGGGAGWVGARS